MVLTTWRSPIVRQYRSAIISVTLSCIFLGIVSGSTPFLLTKLNPDESRLVPLEQLTSTLWSEPLENPTNELPSEELAWSEHYSVKFRFKLHLPFAFKKWITAYERFIVMMDEAGSIRGFDAYTGLNHWSIPLQITELLAFEQQQKKLFILERISHREVLRITCIDLQNPSAVWQRTIPGTSVGGIAFDFDSQSLLVSAGNSGVWALQGKTGEVLWKHPQIYSVISALHAGKFWMVFEPEIAKKTGSWYWIDEQTGKLASKVKHEFVNIGNVTSLSDSILTQTEGHASPTQAGGINLERLQKPELNRMWTMPVTEHLVRVMALNTNQILLIYGANLAELRNLSNFSIVWQKKLSDVDARWTTLTPDQKMFMLPSGSNEIQFFSVSSGEWQFSAKASEPIQWSAFFGDWLYWVSENQLWAYQKK